MSQSRGITSSLDILSNPCIAKQDCNTKPAADAIAGSPRPSLAKLPSPAISPPKDLQQSFCPIGDRPESSNPSQAFKVCTPIPVKGDTKQEPSSDSQNFQGQSSRIQEDTSAIQLDHPPINRQLFTSPPLDTPNPSLQVTPVVIRNELSLVPVDDSLSISVTYNRELWDSVQQLVSDETDQVETYVAKTMLAHLGFPDGNFIGDKNMKEHFMRFLDIPGVPDATIIIDANENPITLPPVEGNPQINLAEYLAEESNYGREVHIKCSQVCEVKPGTAESMILEKLLKSSAFLTWLKHTHPKVICDSFEISIVHDLKAPEAYLCHRDFIGPLVICANRALAILKSSAIDETLTHEKEILASELLELKTQLDEYEVKPPKLTYQQFELEQQLAEYNETPPTLIEDLQNLSQKLQIRAYELDQKGKSIHFEVHNPAKTAGARGRSREIVSKMFRCMFKGAMHDGASPTEPVYDSFELDDY